MYSVRQARIGVGKTQEELAEVLGVSAQTIAKWEKHPEEMRIREVKALAKATGISLAEIDVLTEG